MVACSLIVQAQSARHPQAVPPPPVAPPPALNVVDDPSAPAGWKRYQFKFGDGDTLGLFLPGTHPEESTERIESSPGVVVTEHLFLSTLDFSFYGACYLEIALPGNTRLPENFKSRFSETFNKAFVEGFKQTLDLLQT